MLSALFTDSETSSSTSSLSDNSTVGQLRREHIGLDFKLIVEGKGDTRLVLHLVAPTAQEKAAWVSDIAQVGHSLRPTRAASRAAPSNPKVVLYGAV